LLYMFKLPLDFYHGIYTRPRGLSLSKPGSAFDKLRLRLRLRV